MLCIYLSAGTSWLSVSHALLGLGICQTDSVFTHRLRLRQRCSYTLGKTWCLQAQEFAPPRQLRHHHYVLRDCLATKSRGAVVWCAVSRRQIFGHSSSQ
jgi:hypothetical protein